MDKSLSISFGTPEHGWLPVDLNFGDYNINFDASDVLNDPVNELCETILGLQNNKSGEITWWLEPGAYFFLLEKKDQSFTLTISETDDLHPDHGEIDRKLIKTITGDYKQIVTPFKSAIKQFCAQVYEEKHWPFNCDKNKLNSLLADT
ncbi:MAG: hypothetical protein KA163_02540 [Bacteroidia bacterium]|nr:hypothetical protein [Bacteroidia bacterium]